MSIERRLADDLAAAIRAQDRDRSRVLRQVRAELQRAQIDKGAELDDDAVLGVIRKQVKLCRDAMAQFSKGGRTDLAEKEQAEAALLGEYLPAAPSAEDLAAMVDKALADRQAETGTAPTMRDMGAIMKTLKDTLPPGADLGQASAVLRGKLS